MLFFWLLSLVPETVSEQLGGKEMEKKKTKTTKQEQESLPEPEETGDSLCQEKRQGRHCRGQGLHLFPGKSCCVCSALRKAKNTSRPLFPPHRRSSGADLLVSWGLDLILRLAGNSLCPATARMGWSDGGHQWRGVTGSCWLYRHVKGTHASIYKR